MARSTGVRLTPAAARELKPGGTLWDHEVSGLHLRAAQNSKSWLLYYKTRDATERRPKLGRFPEMSLSSARSVANSLKERIARGEDPVGEWNASKAVPTVADLCERYLNEWARRRLAPNTIRQQTQTIRAQIIPGLGKKRLTEVSRTDVDRFLERVFNREFVSAAERKRRGPTAHWSALTARRLLSKLFMCAIHYFQVEGVDNPVVCTTVYSRKRRRRHATPQEFPRITAALTQLTEEDPLKAACIWTLLLTGGRVSEILNARVDQYIDKGDGRRVLRLSKHKTSQRVGDKEIIVPPAAQEIIAQYGQTAGRLFGELSYSALVRAWWKVRTAAGCPDLKLLDTRRTFASYGLSSGLSLEQIGELLGHTNIQVTKGYAYLLDDTKVKMANEIANAINSAARPSGTPEPSSPYRPS
jgi:integrase